MQTSKHIVILAHCKCTIYISHYTLHTQGTTEHFRIQKLHDPSPWFFVCGVPIITWEKFLISLLCEENTTFPSFVNWGGITYFLSKYTSTTFSTCDLTVSLTSATFHFTWKNRYLCSNCERRFFLSLDVRSKAANYCIGHNQIRRVILRSGVSSAYLYLRELHNGICSLVSTNNKTPFRRNSDKKLFPVKKKNNFQ